VPGEQAARDEDEAGGRELFRAVVWGEPVGLVGQQHQVGRCRPDLFGLDVRVAVRACAEHVVQAEPGQHVAGERARAEDHPRVAPDRHRDAARGPRRGSGPGLLRRRQPGRRLQVERSGEQPAHRRHRVGQRLDHGYPHGQARVTQPVHVQLPVLFPVGDDEVRCQGDDRRPFGILGPPDPGHRQAGRMGDRLAGLGYVALIPDIYYRAGEWTPFDVATLFTDPRERARMSGLTRALTNEAIIADARAYADFLLARPEVGGSAIGTTGY